MPYNMSYYRAAGDPFLGSLIKGVGKIAGAVLPGPVGAAVRTVSGIFGGGARAPTTAALPVIPSTPMPTRYGVGGVRRRRRMNYGNQRALRRSLRRVTGYARQQKAIRKAASEFAREFGPRRSSPRRDLGRGHVHVR